MHDGRLHTVERAVLDACSLVNLYASRRIADILAASAVEYYVCEYVLRHEATYIVSADPIDGSQVKEAIDLSGVIAQSLLSSVTLESEAEAATYIELAMEVDDGEAQTIAIAAHRTMSVVTDDRLARSLMAQRALVPAMFTTGEILEQWAQLTGASDAEVRETLLNVEKGGRFRPPRNDPAYDWWRSF